MAEDASVTKHYTGVLRMVLLTQPIEAKEGRDVRRQLDSICLASLQPIAALSHGQGTILKTPVMALGT